MTSGVAISDSIVTIFNEMKVRKAQAKNEEKKNRKKAAMFRLSDDEKSIILDEEREILVGDLGDTVDDPFQHFVSLLPPKDCRYALYDATFETKESRKEELVFVFW